MSQPSQSTDERDLFDLARFLEAQAGVYDQVMDELRSGQKRSHWIWFIFPQYAGLGKSATSADYAIRSLDEARAYLQHWILGPRLLECTGIVNCLQGRSAAEIFGWPDDVKFRSSMTLFELAAGGPSEFTTALEAFFAGERDARTLALVRLSAPEQDEDQA
jgi:uncharacterized protein (DUF1810 family)